MAIKTFYYKVASFVPDTGILTLEDYLKMAYQNAPKPWQRKQVVKSAADDDSKERNVVGLRMEHLDMNCGVLQHYKEGAPVLVSVHSEDADNFEMVQYPPPVQTDEKKKAEFVKSLLYFAVRGNHVVYIQSHGVDSEDLESHLAWLVKKFGTNGGTQQPPRLFLEDNIPPGYRDEPLKGVRSIVLHSEPEAVAQTEPEPVGLPSSETIVPVPKRQRWAIDNDPLIEGFLNTLRKKKPDAAKNELFKLEDAFRKGTLRASVTLEFVDGGKSDTSPLDTAAHVLRHVKDLPFEMKLPHDEPLKSVDLKVTRSYYVGVKDELIIPKSAFDKMGEMLEALVKSRDILPDPS